jgi:hypothetical protein
MEKKGSNGNLIRISGRRKGGNRAWQDGSKAHALFFA